MILINTYGTSVKLYFKNLYDRNKIELTNELLNLVNENLKFFKEKKLGAEINTIFSIKKNILIKNLIYIF